MSKYTTQLRYICKKYGDDEIIRWFSDYDLLDYLTLDEIKVIENRGTWSKEKLAKKIINHYFMYEIGFETPALFKHYVKTSMQEIMEKYLPLIYSSSIKYDPLVNVDFTESLKRNRDNTGTIKNDGTNSSNSSASASSLNVNSDTPQGQISKNEILSGKYASNTDASESVSSGEDKSIINNTQTNNLNEKEEYTKTVKGNSGVSATAQKMIEQYRQNIITIDRNIINELNELFMGIW